MNNSVNGIPPEPFSPPLPSIRQRLLRGGLWAFVGKFGFGVATLLANAVLARLLAPVEMGAYFLAFSVVSAAALLAQLGFKQATVRLVAESMALQKPGRARSAVRTALLFGSLGTAAVVAILLLGGGHWLARSVFDSEELAHVTTLLALWIIILAMQSLLAEVFRGFHDIRLASIFGGSLTSVLSLFLFGWLWATRGQATLGEVLILAVGAGFVATLLSASFLRQKLHPLPAPTPLPKREAWSIAWPMLINDLTVFALIQADIWIMGAFRPQEEVAVYGAAARLAQVVSLTLIIVNQVVPPLIAELYFQGKKNRLERALRATATLGGVPAFVLMLSFVLFGGSILGVVFGDFYRAGAIVLALLSVGQLVNAWVGSCGMVLTMTGHQSVVMSTSLVSGTLAVAGSFWAVEYYGAPGVAAVMMFATVLKNIILWGYVRRKIGIWTHADLKPSALRRLLAR